MKKKTSIIYTKVVQSLFSAIKQMPKENHVLFCFFVFCVVLFCIVGGTSRFAYTASLYSTVIIKLLYFP